MNRGFLIVGAALAVVGAVAYVALQPGDTSNSGAAQTAPPTPADTTVASSIGRQSTPERAPVASAPIVQPPAARPLSRDDVTAALRSRDIYSKILSLRDKREAGTYIAARSLELHCRQAMVAAGVAKRGLAPAPNPSPAALSARQQAIQEVEARCSAVYQNVDLKNPLSNDEWGIKYATLKANYGSREEILQETARQGAMPYENLLGTVWAAGENPIFEGKPLGGLKDTDQWGAAVTLAQALIDMGPSESGKSLASLVSCITVGTCTDVPDDSLAYFKIDQKDLPRVRETAERIKQAVISNNAASFMKPKPSQ